MGAVQSNYIDIIEVSCASSGSFGCFNSIADGFNKENIISLINKKNINIFQTYQEYDEQTKSMTYKYFNQNNNFSEIYDSFKQRNIAYKIFTDFESYVYEAFTVPRILQYIYGNEVEKYTVYIPNNITLTVSTNLNFIINNNGTKTNEIFILFINNAEGDLLSDSVKDTINIEKLAVNITKSLAIMHDKGYAHRDIKPSNIVRCKVTMTNNIEYKLIDYGFLTNKPYLNDKNFGTINYTLPSILYDIQHNKQIFDSYDANTRDTIDTIITQIYDKQNTNKRLTIMKNALNNNIPYPNIKTWQNSDNYALALTLYDINCSYKLKQHKMNDKLFHEFINHLINTKPSTDVFEYKCDAISLGGASSRQTKRTIIYKSNSHHVYGKNKERYIRTNNTRIYLKDIKGKYRYVEESSLV